MVEKKPIRSLVVFLRKIGKGILPFLCGRQVAKLSNGPILLVGCRTAVPVYHR